MDVVVEVQRANELSLERISGFVCPSTSKENKEDEILSKRIRSNDEELSDNWF